MTYDRQREARMSTPDPPPSGAQMTGPHETTHTRRDHLFSIETPRPGPPRLLLLLAALLTVGEPVLFAYAWSPHIANVLDRGTVAVTFFILRVLITGLGVAAGTALWQRRPHALPMIELFLALSTAASAVTLGTSILPGRPAPGMALPIFLFTAAYNGAWFAYVHSLSNAPDEPV